MWPPFVSFLPHSSLRDKKPSACRQRALNSHHPPSYLARLKYLWVVHSSSVPSDLAAELNCMEWDGMCRSFQRMSTTTTNIFTCPVTHAAISQFTVAQDIWDKKHIAGTQKAHSSIFTLLLCLSVCKLPILSFYLSFAVALWGFSSPHHSAFTPLFTVL